MFKKLTTNSKSKLASAGALIAAFAMVACLGLAGCSSSSNDSTAESPAGSSVGSSMAAEAQEDISVTVNIGGNENNGLEAATETVVLPANSSVTEALNATSYVIVSENGNYGTFVTSINGVASTDATAWVYTVNGEQIEMGADECMLNDGDIVEWTLVDF